MHAQLLIRNGLTIAHTGNTVHTNVQKWHRLCIEGALRKSQHTEYQTEYGLTVPQALETCTCSITR